MKKITATLLTAVLLVSLTGCKPNEESPDTPNSPGSSSAITDSSDNSGSSDSSSAPESAPEPQKPAGEPTFLTAPDGTPIYTSEISEVYTGSEFLGDKETITLEQAEQMAQTGDGHFAIKCDGFIYGHIPEKALNRIENPDMFIEDEHGSFDYLGETSDNNGMEGKRMTDFTRFNVGDKIGELTVKNAYTLFVENPNYSDTSYVPGAHISSYYIELDGAIELEGYICVTPMDTLYGEGGDLKFFPNGESSKKLPSLGCNWDSGSNEYYHRTLVWSEGYVGDWYLALGNMYKIDCDTSGLQPGDSMVKAKISLENLRCASKFNNGREFDLKSIEII